MGFVIEGVLVRHDPAAARLPVLFDSPHSGAVYPGDFRVLVPMPILRQAEDSYVDELFAEAPRFGATLLCALFPRTCIDANRAVDDIDPRVIDGPWPTLMRPSARSGGGLGLIRTLCRPGMPLYAGRLPAAEVAARIERFYHPYHAEVAAAINANVAAFGASWHVDCHSMPSCAAAADFVIGDRDGTTSERGFVDLVARTLRGLGYAVALNHPYKGVELVRRYGKPGRGRHSIQIEISRRLYMDEETLEPHAGFAVVRRDLTALAGEICAYATSRTARRAAE